MVHTKCVLEESRVSYSTLIGLFLLYLLLLRVRRNTIKYVGLTFHANYLIVIRDIQIYTSSTLHEVQQSIRDKQARWWEWEALWSVFTKRRDVRCDDLNIEVLKTVETKGIVSLTKFLNTISIDVAKKFCRCNHYIYEQKSNAKTCKDSEQLVYYLTYHESTRRLNIISMKKNNLTSRRVKEQEI